MATLVSVYLPTKNRVDSLKLAIDSVLRQGHGEFELIAVDDGSTDETPDYLHRASMLDSRIRFIRKDVSGGAPAARNSAILEARGDFVTGLDDDDLFLPHRLESFISYWNLLLRWGPMPSCLYALDIFKVESADSIVYRKSGNVAFEDMFEGNKIGNQIFAPKAHYVDVGLFDVTLPAWQDLDLFFRILKKYGNARLLDTASYVFDNSERSDRISNVSAKVRSAFDLVSVKHASDSPRRRQMLFLQIFSGYYGFRPTVTDIAKFAKDGFWFYGLKYLVKAMIYNRK